MKSKSILAITLLPLLGLFACGDDSDSPTAAPPSGASRKIVTMTGSLTFVPRDLTIEKGDTVVWFNGSSALHTATSGKSCTPDGLWDSGNMGLGATFEVVFDSTGIDTTGLIDYYCIPHCGSNMAGTITINP